MHLYCADVLGRVEALIVDESLLFLFKLYPVDLGVGASKCYAG